MRKLLRPCLLAVAIPVWLIAAVAGMAQLRAWAAGPRPDGVARFNVFGCALAAHGSAS